MGLRMIEYMENIAKNEIVGLILSSIFFTLSVYFWYWVCFRDGAQTWSDEIVKYYKKIKMGFIGNLFWFKPTALKVLITICLLCLIVAFIFVFQAEWKNIVGAYKQMK
jgi:hypothetical protein